MDIRKLQRALAVIGERRLNDAEPESRLGVGPDLGHLSAMSDFVKREQDKRTAKF